MRHRPLSSFQVRPGSITGGGLIRSKERAIRQPPVSVPGRGVWAEPELQIKSPETTGGSLRVRSGLPPPRKRSKPAGGCLRRARTAGSSKVLGARNAVARKSNPKSIVPEDQPRVSMGTCEPCPRLAIVFPCHPSRAGLVRRSLFALRAQTVPPDWFEVIVAVDGGDPRGKLEDALEPSGHPFDVTMVSSRRTRGELPHRNHARNAGWRAARAPLCWVMDADFIFEPTLIEHALTVYEQQARPGYPIVLTPVMSAIAESPQSWLRRSEFWSSGGAPVDFLDLLAHTRICGGVYSGFHKQFSPGAPRSVALKELPEGMPLLWKDLLEALGGFDERFVGWGGNKEELVDRLKGLRDAGLIELRLLTSARALHQPHVHDSKGMKRRGRENQRIRERRRREILSGDRWWRRQLFRTRAVVARATDYGQRGG